MKNANLVVEEEITEVLDSSEMRESRNCNVHTSSLDHDAILLQIPFCGKIKDR